jgi:peroxiredoxin
MQQSAGGKRFSERLAALRKSSVLGKMMPDFTLNSNEGKPVHFADFRGKYVLVDVWASYCAPCRAETPNILAAYNRYKDKNFTVLGISVDRDEEHWKKAIQHDKSTWTQVLNAKREIEEINNMTDIFLVDPDGKIIATGLKGQALHKKLAELFDK